MSPTSVPPGTATTWGWGWGAGVHLYLEDCVGVGWGWVGEHPRLEELQGDGDSASCLCGQLPAKDGNGVCVRKGHCEAEVGVVTDGADERRVWIERGPGSFPRSNWKATQDLNGAKIKGEKPPLLLLPMQRAEGEVGRSNV